MTNTDNKDPQITPEIVQEWKELEILEGNSYSGAKMKILVDAFLEQAAELKQLRAERAGFEDWLKKKKTAATDLKDENAGNDSANFWEGIVQAYQLVESKLTDSAQRSVTKEESDILKQALIDSSETVHEGKLEQPPQPAEGEPEQKEGESWQDMKRMKVSDGGTVLLKQPRKEHEGE